MAKYIVKPLSSISEIGLKKLDKTDCTLDNSTSSPDGILIRSTKIDGANLSNSLLAISRAGVGVNNIPLQACSDKGVVVFNTPGANANAVKELVLAGLMLSSRNVYSSIDFVNKLGHLKDMKDLEPFLEENKKQFKGKELAGSTLGVIGLGAIGSKVAGMGVALEMEVFGFDPALSVEAAWKLPSQVLPVENMEDIFKNSDFISVHIPALETTKEIINNNLFKYSKGASLLNFARHEVVNTEHVIEALESNNLGNFITDFPTPDLKKRMSFYYLILEPALNKQKRIALLWQLTKWLISWKQAISRIL